MARTVGATQMNDNEKVAAAALVACGFSFRKVGEMLGRSDHAVKAACKSVGNSKGNLSVREKQRLDKMAGLQAWLAEGKTKGYLEALASLGAVT